GTRATINAIKIERDEKDAVVGAMVELEMVSSFGGTLGGFTFAAIAKPLENRKRYTLDADPNNIYGYWNKKVMEGLILGGENPLYRRWAGQPVEDPSWPVAANEGQQRFWAGLAALH